MPQINVYIDGFNLYHAIVSLNEPTLKWLNFRTLGASFLRPGEQLNKVSFFTAVLTWEKEKQQRHKNYIRAQIASGVEVVESNFRRMNRHCRVMDRYCARHEEKQTDVAIAISVFKDAMAGEFDRAVLITADSDQVPLVRAMRDAFPEKRITLAAPPGRGGEARELGAIAHDRTPIEAGRLRGCKLPRDVVDARGKTVATMPAIYQT
jgi:uncharacterized LabA/DUF88 family protein